MTSQTYLKHHDIITHLKHVITNTPKTSWHHTHTSWQNTLETSWHHKHTWNIMTSQTDMNHHDITFTIHLKVHHNYTQTQVLNAHTNMCTNTRVYTDTHYTHSDSTRLRMKHEYIHTDQNNDRLTVWFVDEFTCGGSLHVLTPPQVQYVTALSEVTLYLSCTTICIITNFNKTCIGPNRLREGILA